MADYDIRCEIIEAADGEYACAKVGETYVIVKGIPEGMCDEAFAVIYPSALAMRSSDKTDCETDEGYIDITCPDQDVVFRLSRIKS